MCSILRVILVVCRLQDQQIAVEDLTILQVFQVFQCQLFFGVDFFNVASFERELFNRKWQLIRKKK